MNLPRNLKQRRDSLVREISVAQDKLYCLSHPFVQAMIAQHPDCDVSLYISNPGEYSRYTITLSSHFFSRDVKSYNEDIREAANGADNDGFVLAHNIILYSDQDLTINLACHVYQDFDDDEREVLRAIGKLVEEPNPREILMCNA